MPVRAAGAFLNECQRPPPRLSEASIESCHLPLDCIEPNCEFVGHAHIRVRSGDIRHILLAIGARPSSLVLSTSGRSRQSIARRHVCAYEICSPDKGFGVATGFGEKAFDSGLKIDNRAEYATLTPMAHRNLLRPGP